MKPDKRVTFSITLDNPPPPHLMFKLKVVIYVTQVNTQSYFFKSQRKIIKASHTVFK